MSLISHFVTINSRQRAILQVTIPCRVNRVNSCSVLSPHTTTTTLCIFYAEPCTTCCVGFLYIPVYVVSQNVPYCASIFSYKTHDCVHLLHRAHGSSTTTSGVAPAQPKCRCTCIYTLGQEWTACTCTLYQHCIDTVTMDTAVEITTIN